MAVVKAGADRVCVDALLHDAPQRVHELSAQLGAQALIASLPLSRNADKLVWLDHRTRQTRPLEAKLLNVLRSAAVSEALIIDWQREGQACGFDASLVADFPVQGVPLIAFGGLSEPYQLRELLQMERVAAVAVGNFLNYREHAIHNFKAHLTGLPVRPAALMQDKP